MTMIWYPGPY